MTDALFRPTFPALRTLVAATVLLACTLTQAASLSEAQNYLRQGQQAKALEEVNELVSTNPKDRQARFFKGVVLAEMNRLDEAASIFTKLTEEAPELPEPYNNLAVIYAQQKQYDKARTALEMSIRTHPTYATAHENLGDLYTQMARQAYDRALQIDAANSNAQAKLKLIRDIMSVGGRGGATATASKPNTTVAAATPPAPVTPPPTPATNPQTATPPQPATPAKPVTPPPPVSPPIAQASSSKAAPPVQPAAPVEKPVAQNASSEIQKAVEAWAAAWSHKDVKAYLSFYARDFDVPGGATRKAWEAERESRIDKPGVIKVSLSDVRVQVQGEQANAQFRQHYASKSLNTSTPKTLVLVHQGGRWLIQQERVGR